MSFLSLIRKYPPAWSSKFFYILVTGGYIWRFLAGSIFGLFLLSVTIYGLMWFVGETEPFTPTQLLLWVADLPTDAKALIASSVLTIVGFLIAFHTATLNWRHQEQAHLKTVTAGEIEQFFAEASLLLTDVDIYARSLVEGVDKIQSQPLTRETVFRIEYLLEQTPLFLGKRQRLSVMSVEVHRILGKNFAVLLTVWGATKELEEAIDAFGEMTQAMWFRVPFMQKGDPNLLERFLAEVSAAECTKFRASYEKNYDFVNGITGGIRGLLLAPIVGFNLSSLVGLLKNRAQIRRMIDEFYRRGRHSK